MKLNRVLIVHKRLSILQNGIASQSFKNERREQHEATIQKVTEKLEELGIEFSIIDRSALIHKPEVDLIITVGGDGTVIAASHVARGIPVLGVNSMPASSVGFYCSANAKSFSSKIDRIISGKDKPKELPMLAASIDGKALPFPILNDILFTNSSPAESVYYTLNVGGKKEFQRGSGLWICAGPGSTAGFHSAGGVAAPMISRKLRFIVREPCALPRRKFKFIKGVLSEKETLSITCENEGAAIFVDGTSYEQPMKPRQTLKVRISLQSFFLFHR